MSGATREDVYRLIGYIEDDLRGISAKFTEVRSMLAAGAMSRAAEDRTACPKCGVPLGSGERTLALHIQNVHAGPLVPLTPDEDLG